MLTRLVRRRTAVSLAAALLVGAAASAAQAEWIWVEGEQPARSTMHAHSWYNSVKKNDLSGGNWISNFDDQKRPALAGYNVRAQKAGTYDFWIRANPVQTKIEYQLNNGKWTDINLDNGQTGNTNIAADNKPDLRFIAWEHVGEVDLKAGVNTVVFRFDSANSHHGGLDCFVFTNEPFQPDGILKPNQIAAANKSLAAGGWFPWNPAPDKYQDSPIDMRWLNEKQAGDGGFIAVKNGDFVHSKTGEPVRFWGVNGGPWHGTPDQLAATAEFLAKHGVNLCRFQTGYFQQDGSVVPGKIEEALASIQALKKEGIYTHFSIYFPLWLKPKGSAVGLNGYPANGSKVAFAVLFF